MLKRGPYWPPIQPPAFVKAVLKTLLYLYSGNLGRFSRQVRKNIYKLSLPDTPESKEEYQGVGAYLSLSPLRFTCSQQPCRLYPAGIRARLCQTSPGGPGHKD